MQRKSNKNLKIKTENQLGLTKSLVKKLKQGVFVPLIHFKNLNALFSQLDKDKTLSEIEKKEILSFILKNNEKQIERKKIDVEKLKVKNGSKGKRNWDGGYQHKYSLNQFESLRNQVKKAKADVTKAQSELDAIKIQKVSVCNDAKNCRPTWKKKCGEKRGACGWYTNTGINTRTKALTDVKSKYAKLKAQLELREEQDNQFVTRQKQDAEESRKKQLQLNEQEKHEAELKADGLNLQSLKMEIAKQAAEISKLDKEKAKYETEANKIKTSKNFGANITQNIKDNSKMYFIITIAVISVISAIVIFMSKSKKQNKHGG